jgi:hypothetical protein
MGAAGAGFYERGRLAVAPAAPVRQHQNSAGAGDLLSVCMMLLHACAGISSRDRLHLANTIVAEYIDGRRTIIPNLTQKGNVIEPPQDSEIASPPVICDNRDMGGRCIGDDRHKNNALHKRSLS